MILVLMAIFSLVPAYAGKPGFSLMLSQAEQEALRAFTKKKQTSELASNEIDLSPGAINKDIVYLSSILDFGDNKWTIWLNDRPLHPEEHHDWPFNIVAVNFHSLTVQLDTPGRKVTLAPHQSLNIRDGQVFDGDYRRSNSESSSHPNTPSSSGG